MKHRLVVAGTMGILLTAACNTEQATGPAARNERLPADPVPALVASGANASLSVGDPAFATASDPDVQALANTTQLVRWYYIMNQATQRWYIVNPTTGSVLLLDGVDETTSFGIYWKPINRYEAASGGGSQRYQSAFDNYASVTLAADGRSIRFGNVTGNTTDAQVTALAGSVQPVRWYYVYNPGNTRWYIVSPVGRQVLMLHHVERMTTFGIHWKPISNVAAAASPSTSTFTDAGDNYSGLSIAADGSSILFSTDASPAPTGQNTGSLQITISGLDAAAQAGVSVTGPGGFNVAVHSTTNLTDLVPGTYSIVANEVTGLIRYAATQASQQVSVGSNAVAAVTLSYGPVRLPVLSGQASLDNRTRTEVFLAQYGTNNHIDPSRRTWIIVHGRLNGPADVDAIAAAVRRQSGDQVLVFSWEAAARETALWVGYSNGEQWIVPVGQWAARVLKAYGFAGDNINLIGHSWGSYVADELAEEMGGVDVIVGLDPARNTIGSNYNVNDQNTIHFGAHSQYALTFNASGFGNEVTPTTADEAFAVQFRFLAAPWDRHNWIKDLFTALLDGNGAVSSMFRLQRLLEHRAGPWKPDQYQADDPNTPTLLGDRLYEGILIASTSAHVPASLKYRDSIGTEQTISEATVQAPPPNGLALEVSPTGSQTVPPGGLSRFDIRVTDGSGVLMNGATVSGIDPFTRQSFTLATGSNGQIMRNVLVPNGTSSGSYSITFTASKAGYASSATATRLILVQQSSTTPQALALTVSPASVQTKDWGQSVLYQVTVTDATGAAVSGATVSGNDPVSPRAIQLTTAANGTASLTVTVPTGLANASYNLTFTAGKHGYASSNTVTRQLVVQHATQASNLLTNGGFEQGATGWSFSGNAFASTTLSNSRSGSGYAFMGTNSSGIPVDNAAAVMHQAVSIPSPLSTATLRFWVSITTTENPAGSAYDFMNVIIVNSAGVVLKNLAQFSNLDAGGYRQFSADLTEYRGQSIRIIFSMSSDSSLPTVFRLDDFSLGSP